MVWNLLGIPRIESPGCLQYAASQPCSKMMSEEGDQELLVAPTFRPTDAEFANPMRYILSIREHAEQFGICCIVPPASWRPPFVLDMNKLAFPTRIQKTNELLVRKVQRVKFMKELSEYWDRAGSPLTKLPVLGGSDIDLHLLHLLVTRHGGFDRVGSGRKWTEVATSMNIHTAGVGHVSASLKRHYQQLLLPFDRFRAGLETLPEPAAPAAAPALLAVPEPEPALVSVRVRLQGAALLQTHAAAAAAAPAKDAAPMEQAAPMEESAREHESAGGGLMSRRGKGSTAAELVKLQAGATSNAVEEEVIVYEPPKPGEEVCEVCGSGDRNEAMLLCDRCQCGFHMECLTPPLSKVPAGDWFCGACLNENFGFGNGRVFKFHHYERQVRKRSAHQETHQLRAAAG